MLGFPYHHNFSPLVYRSVRRWLQLAFACTSWPSIANRNSELDIGKLRGEIMILGQTASVQTAEQTTRKCNASDV